MQFKAMIVLFLFTMASVVSYGQCTLEIRSSMNYFSGKDSPRWHLVNDTNYDYEVILREITTWPTGNVTEKKKTRTILRGQDPLKGGFIENHEGTKTQMEIISQKKI